MLVLCAAPTTCHTKQYITLTATSSSFSSRAVIADPCSPNLAHLLLSFSPESLNAPLAVSFGPPCLPCLFPLVVASTKDSAGICRRGFRHNNQQAQRRSIFHAQQSIWLGLKLTVIRKDNFLFPAHS